jgi:predicted DNA-binding transcriptional regulator AlpA
MIAALTVDTEGASRHIGLAASTLEKLRVSGGGPRYVKLGRAVRYRLADLEDYLAERVRENTSA